MNAMDGDQAPPPNVVLTMVNDRLKARVPSLGKTMIQACSLFDKDRDGRLRKDEVRKNHLEIT
jgi:hypothetical protein